MKSSFLNWPHPVLLGITECRDPESIITDMINCYSDGANAFGIELSHVPDCYKNLETYKRIFSFSGNKPLYITNYRLDCNEGKSDEELVSELMVSLDAGATLIDVMGDLYDPQPLEISYDKSADEKQRELINSIHQKGGEVLISSHTHKFLPPEEVLKIAQTQESRGADISKIVTMADSQEELLENLRASFLLKEKLHIPFLFLSCGRYARIQRLMGHMFGSYIVLGVHEHTNDCTRYQPLLRNCLNILSNNYWEPDRP